VKTTKQNKITELYNCQVQKTLK